MDIFAIQTLFEIFIAVAKITARAAQIT